METKWKIKLKKYMKQRKLNQREFSSITGVNVFTLNRWVNGRTTPSALWQEKLNRNLK